MARDIPEFGQKRPGERYDVRPGAYAVMFDEEGLVALIKTRRGFYLPGGGIAGIETPEQALEREVREECASSVRILGKLGEAMQYLDVKHHGFYLCKHGHFFRAEMMDGIDGVPEEDHEVVWLEVSEAVEVLMHPSQAWAVQLASA